MSTRVVQWATGSVGGAQLREVVDRPDLELVGVFVYGPDKVGVDAGTLVGRPPPACSRPDDKAAILALDADVVLHAASKAFAHNTNTDDIVALPGVGQERHHDDLVQPPARRTGPTPTRCDPRARVRRAGVRFHAAGEHPGFMFERLATSVTALSQRVDKITVQEFVDVSGVSAREMLVELMGMGKQPEEISIESPMFRAVSVQYEQAIGAAADVLGLAIDEVRHEIETATVSHDVVVACGTLPAGSVVGQIMSWTGYRDGAPVLVAEEYWVATRDIPGWDLALERQFLVRVIVDGVPPLRVELTIPNGAVDEPRGHVGRAAGGGDDGGPGHSRTSSLSPPGVVAAPVFGAYRWPA